MTEEFLKPTEFLDYDNSSVKDFAEQHAGNGKDPREKMIHLYYAVRDGFLYNPYHLDLRREGLRASNLLQRTRGYCIEKAILLAACARYFGVPSRLSFYIVRNHVGTERLEKVLQKDYIVFHGAAELYLDGKWLKATPAFNASLCKHLRVDPLDFDGTQDCIFQQYDRNGNVFMSYLHDYGAFADLPYELYLAELNKHYGQSIGNSKYQRAPFVYDFTQS